MAPSPAASLSLRFKSFHTALHIHSEALRLAATNLHASCSASVNSCVMHTPCVLLRRKDLTNDHAWQCRWRHIITDAFLVVLAACFTAFTVMKVQSAQRDVGGSFWKAVKEHPQLTNDWAICIAQWTGNSCVLLLLQEKPSVMLLMLLAVACRPGLIPDICHASVHRSAAPAVL